MLFRSPAFTVEEIPVPAGVVGGDVSIVVEPVVDGSRVTVVAVDRVGLLADVAAVFALRRVTVRAARLWAQGDYAVSVWDVAEAGLDWRDAYSRVVADAPWEKVGTTDGEPVFAV